MFIVLGATGHVGGAVIDHLKVAGQPVIGVTHTEEGASALRAKGIKPAIADVTDSDALRAVLRRGKRAFLLNPPADPSVDTDAREERTVRAIAQALDGSGLEKVVVESTYGVQEGRAIGDFTTLCHFEQQVKASGIPTAINRGAYYFSNFDVVLPAAREGKLPTMLPETLDIPMVAPADLGAFAARRLMSEPFDTGVRYIEGPRRYSVSDVADALSDALGREVAVETSPRERWEADFRSQGFSEAAARSYARMTTVSIDGGFVLPDAPERGATTLEAYIAGVTAQAAS